MYADTCDIQPAFHHIINHCRDEYNWLDDDTKDYLPGWVVPTEENNRKHTIYNCYEDAFELENSTGSLRDEDSPWIYRNSVELKNAPYAGMIAMYKGGGYTFTFKRNGEKTQKLLEVHKEKMQKPDTVLFLTIYNRCKILLRYQNL